MLFFPKLNKRSRGKRLTVTSAQGCDDRKSENKTAAKHRQMQEPNPGKSFTVLCRLLLLALAVFPAIAAAQESDNGRDHGTDPIGAWLVTDEGTDGQPSVLATFHKDGTASGDVRGDVTGFPEPIFFSHEHGLWKKTGARTFTATFVALEYNRDNSLFAIFEVDANFRLDASGDQYDSDFVATETLTNGQVNHFGPGKSHGVRIRLKPPAL
jgi:hypothetical protein